MTRKEACYFLGIREDSSEEQVKRAYRYKAKLYHPDVNPDEDTKEYYIKVQKAYEYLIENPYVPPSGIPETPNAADKASGSNAAGYGQAGSGMNMGGNMYTNAPFGTMAGNAVYGVPPVSRPAKVYSSTASTRAHYQKQKDKEKERVKIQKWDKEYKDNKKYQQNARLYGKEYADSVTGKSEEDRILEKIRAIWLAETIRRQIAADRENKEASQRRKLYKAFMQQEMQDGDGAEKMPRTAKDAD